MGIQQSDASERATMVQMVYFRVVIDLGKKLVCSVGFAGDVYVTKLTDTGCSVSFVWA
jgi:hypothetical protein